MDTRFWGPSGWKLLHLITFTYEPNIDNQPLLTKNFLETLPYILPCKFCRASLTDYYRELPFEIEKDGKIESVLESRDKFTKWMYDIHNLVNNKLRKQGLNPNQDPNYQSVKGFYEKWLRGSTWQEQLLTFWDFLFSVAYNHPKETTKQSKPMPECPKDIYKCTDKCEKNKWNVLGIKDRLYWYKRFWDFLPAVLPIHIQERWLYFQTKYKPTIECRRSSIAWLWRMRCALDPQFSDPYTQVCKRIATYSSDCSKSINGKTCRKNKTRKIVKHAKL
jgi:nitroimidazol reductase NimA-like FMN-containing flavoprotein (pyridoxamine 5'-phosphate oxidase superfamily)